MGTVLSMSWCCTGDLGRSSVRAKLTASYAARKSFRTAGGSAGLLIGQPTAVALVCVGTPESGHICCGHQDLPTKVLSSKLQTFCLMRCTRAVATSLPCWPNQAPAMQERASLIPVTEYVPFRGADTNSCVLPCLPVCVSWTPLPPLGQVAGQKQQTAVMPHSRSPIYNSHHEFFNVQLPDVLTVQVGAGTKDSSCGGGGKRGTSTRARHGPFGGGLYRVPACALPG